jgi:hypothetical protein
MFCLEQFFAHFGVISRWYVDHFSVAFRWFSGLISPGAFGSGPGAAANRNPP